MLTKMEIKKIREGRGREGHDKRSETREEDIREGEFMTMSICARTFLGK
jgi:hypothetical protein